MPATHTDRALPTNINSLPLISDDECVIRLAEAVEHHDDEHLDEVALLIGRLAVPIEI
ncbi:hypothetical protein [Tardiphaga alba]|uniref:hypothetical protein n=1 Tax=Tardiphaga alba TaxID=340268 RepID=UPI001BAA9F50|nr:hypothetical protein [Tardiphaga alba]